MYQFTCIKTQPVLIYSRENPYLMTKIGGIREIFKKKFMAGKNVLPPSGKSLKKNLWLEILCEDQEN